MIYAFIVTAQVEDLAKWEEGFRTHGDLFRSQTVSGSIGIGTNEDNEVSVCFEATDLDTFMRGMDSAAAAESMAADGIKRDTVKVFVLDPRLRHVARNMGTSEKGIRTAGPS